MRMALREKAVTTPMDNIDAQGLRDRRYRKRLLKLFQFLVGHPLFQFQFILDSPFHTKQAPLEIHTKNISAKSPIAADNAVTRDNDL